MTNKLPLSYHGIHQWIRKRKPRPELCCICDQRPATELANVSGEYKLDINDFDWTCHKCNMNVVKTPGHRFAEFFQDYVYPNWNKLYHKNKHIHIKRLKIYYLENREHLLNKNKNSYRQNKEKKLKQVHIYSKKHKQEISLRHKKYYQKNKILINLKQKLYYLKNREKRLSYAKNYRQKNKDKR